MKINKKQTKNIFIGTTIFFFIIVVIRIFFTKIYGPSNGGYNPGAAPVNVKNVSWDIVITEIPTTICIALIGSILFMIIFYNSYIQQNKKLAKYEEKEKQRMEKEEKKGVMNSMAREHKKS